MGLNRRSGVWAFVGLLALLLGAGGCNTGNEADSSPSVSEGTATQTSLPAGRPTNVEPPPRPPAMDNADEAGAVAAAEYFLRLTVYAAASGDTTELEAMSGEGCEFCARFVTGVKEIHGNNGWVELATVTVNPVDVWSSLENPGSFRVDLEAKRSGYSFSPAGDGQDYSEEEDLAIGFLITPDPTRWIVNDFQTGDLNSYGIGNE